jgi:hypothetical protein
MITIKKLAELDNIPFGTLFRIACTEEWDVIVVDGTAVNITREQYLPYIEELNDIAVECGFNDFCEMIIDVPAEIDSLGTLCAYLAPRREAPRCTQVSVGMKGA